MYWLILIIPFTENNDPTSLKLKLSQHIYLFQEVFHLSFDVNWFHNFSYPLSHKVRMLASNKKRQSSRYITLFSSQSKFSFCAQATFHFLLLATALFLVFDQYFLLK